uniref:C6 domain-containing protein n=1 Tax=Strongyloides venezuelensis TaxID=75913 RepID=A0A0K0FMV9_STRVS
MPLVFNCAVSHTGKNKLSTVTTTSSPTTIMDYYDDETTTTTTVATTTTTELTTTTTTSRPCNSCKPLVHTLNGAGSIDFTETEYISVDTGCNTVIIECSTTVAGEAVSFYYDGDLTADTNNLATIERVLNCDGNGEWQSVIAGGAVTSIECISA